MIKLYGTRGARSERVTWMLKELDVDYDYTEINLMKGEGQTPEYKSKCATGKIPFIEDREFELFESCAIVNYLAEKYPEKKLIPQSGSFDRARYDQWMFFAVTEIDPYLALITQHTYLLPEVKREKKFVEYAKPKLEQNFQIVEEHLSDREYLLGDHFQACDIIYGHFATWANWIKARPSSSPNLDKYWDRLLKREACPLIGRS